MYCRITVEFTGELQKNGQVWIENFINTMELKGGESYFYGYLIRTTAQ